MSFTRIVRVSLELACIAWFTCMLAGCAGSPEATAQWYLSDKPADMRVPVSGQSDPGAHITPVED